MKYCLKWENVEIIGFQVLKWNEKLMRNNISGDNAIFVFRSHPDGGVKRIFQVKLRSLLEHWPSYSTGDFRACVDSSAFSAVLVRSGLFWMKSPEDKRVARNLVNYTRSFFEFSGFTINCPFAPRLVFVLDFSYDPRIHMDCPSSLIDIPSSTLPVIPLCSIPHCIPGFAFSDNAEEHMLRLAPAYDSDQSEDNEVDSDEAGHEKDPNDPENRYPEETKELVRRLRRYRNVGRTFPLKPMSSMDPVGMVEVGRPMMWALKSPSDDCELCKAKMKVADVVVRVNCDHIFHRDCAMSLICMHKMCPLCRAPTTRRI